MSRRTHLGLRLGALALLAVMAVLPRTRGDARAEGGRSAARAAARVTARAETTSARPAMAARTTKLVVAEADESRLTN